jgi:hypothetical protein
MMGAKHRRMTEVREAAQAAAQWLPRVTMAGASRETAQYFETALTRAGYEFTFSGTRSDALRMAPDLYIVDLRDAVSSDRDPPQEGREAARVRSRAARAPIASGLATARSRFALLTELLRRPDRPPILVAADETRQAGLIREVLAAGVEDVMGIAGARIPELVRARVGSLLHISSLPHDAPQFRYASPSEPAHERGPASFEYQRISRPPVAEHPEAATSDAEARAARRRVREATLPSLADRRRPLAELLEIPTPELRSGSGRLHAKSIAERLGISLRDLATALDVSHQALSKTPDSKRIQERLDPIARTLGLLDELVGGDSVRAWLNTRNPRLNEETPLSALMAGDAEKVARLLGTVRDGGVPS